MSSVTDATQNANLSAQLIGHVVKVRLAHVLPHAPLADGATAVDVAAEIATTVTTWTGVEEEAREDAKKVYGAFKTVDLAEVMPDGATEAVATMLGFFYLLAEDNAKLAFTVDKKEIWAIEPAGPKMLCLSNLRMEEYDDDDQHHHVEVKDDEAGTVALELADGGKKTELKLLSIFPWGAFKVAPGGFSDAGAKMAAYIAAPDTATSDLAIDDVVDTDSVVRGPATHDMSPVTANDLAVEQRQPLVIGNRVRYDPTRGLKYPPDGYDATTLGSRYISDVADADTTLTASRRRVLSAFSKVEGTTDSINTYDARNRLSWGILNWITGVGPELDGELNHVLAFLGREADYAAAFDAAFMKYGFSVWYAEPRPDAATYASNITPFTTPKILFPGCHGPNLAAFVDDRQNGGWQNHRSIYGSWVFRRAGQVEALQRAQVAWANYRLSKVLGSSAEAEDSERTIVSRLSKSVNPGAYQKGTLTPTDQFAVRESGIDSYIAERGWTDQMALPFVDE